MKCRILTQKTGIWAGFLLLLLSPAMAQESARKQTTLIQKGNASAVENTTRMRKVARPYRRPDNTIRSGKSANELKAPGDTLYYEGFEFTTWPAPSSGLLQLNLDGKPPGNNPGQTINTTTFGNNAWVSLAAPPSYTQGGRIAASLSWTTVSGPVNRWLVTPTITLTEGNRFRWKATASNISFPDGYVVKICTNCPDPVTNTNVEAAFSTTLFTIAAEGTASQFVTREVDLSAYSGQTVRLAILNNSNDMDRLYIDDLLVYKTPPIEVSAGQIFSPGPGIYDCAKTNFPVILSVFNGGSKTAYDIAIKVKSTGPQADSTEVLLDSIKANSGDTIALDSGLNLSAPGNYSILYTVTAEGDAGTANNQASKTFTTPQAQSGNLAFDFEDLTLDNPSPLDWFSTSRFLPIDETGGFNNSIGLLIPVFNNFGTLGTENENSIITAKFTGVPADGQLTFKYKIATNTGADYQFVQGDSVVVQVFKNCQPAGEPYVLSDANQTASSDYTKAFIPLAPYNLTSTDEVSVEIRAVAAPATPIYLLNIDDVIFGTVPDGDISLIGIEKPANTIYKWNQVATYITKGSVFNEGSTTLAPIKVKVTALPSDQADSASISSLVGGFSRPFTTAPGLTFNENGDYTILASASVPGVEDPNPADNSTDFTLSISDSTMAKDAGDPVNDIGLGYGPTSGGKRVFANAITTTAKDTCTSVSIYVGTLDTDVSAKSFVGTPNAAGTGWVEDSSSTLVPITQDLSNSWVTLRHRSSIGNQTVRPRGRAIAANTTNLYGVKIRSGNLRVLFNFDNTSDNGSYVWLSGQWLPTQDLTIGAVTFFVRPNFGRLATLRPVSTAQLEQSLQFAEIVPNPSNGEACLALAMNKATPMNVSVLSLDGRELRKAAIHPAVGVNRIALPSAGLAKGMYLVRIQAEGFQSVKKMVID